MRLLSRAADRPGITRSWVVLTFALIVSIVLALPRQASARVTALSATALSADTIELQWQARVSPEQRGFVIYRSLSRTTGYAAVGIAASSATSYRDSGLASGTTYYYRLRSVARRLSAYSRAAHATTLSGPGPGAGTPNANAGPDQMTQTLMPVRFDGSASTDQGGRITSYAWAFGDGGTATGVVASHTYTRPGTFTAVLIVTDAGGQTASDSARVTVLNHPPVANAGPDQSVAAGTAVSFIGSGSDPDGTISAYAWTFGDGGSASGATATHVYSTAGTYTATLTVTDNLGAQGSDTAVVTVTGGPSGGTSHWATTFGGTNFTDNVTPHAIAVAPSGDVVVVGSFTGTVNFGAGALASAGGNDIFLATYAGADGRLRWAKRFGSTSDDYGVGVAVDGSGNVFVTGSFSGSVDFGGGPLTSSASTAFVAKFTAGGALLWSKSLRSAGGASGTALAVDPSGNVVVTGNFGGTIDCGGGVLTSAGQWDVFLAAFGGGDGRYLWSLRAGGSGFDIPYGVAVDKAGHVVVTGVFQGAADFGGGRLASAGGYDVFVAQYAAANGGFAWAKRFGGTGNDYGMAVAVDASGNVVVGGDFTGTIDFGGGPLVDPGSPSAMFVARLSAAGAHLWSKQFGTGRYAAGITDVAVDGTGNVLLTGLVVDAVDFGGGPLAMSGGYDPVVVKLAPTGGHVWSTRFPSGSNAYNASAGVAADSSGAVIASGDFTGTITLDGALRTDANGRVSDSYDGFLVKLAR